MSDKIFRDPLYNYICINRRRDGWLIELLDSPEVQRLRRIHQLGVSNFTYPGADHNRLAHSLGVVHLMQQALHHLQTTSDDRQIEQAGPALLAAALLHDVGHGPFSHLFEPCLDIDHEVWSKKIILCEDKDLRVNKVLRSLQPSLPITVSQLIDKDDATNPSWMKYLLSSQLDMDRLDYLRRDSLFTGAGYGHFDFYRILNTFELHSDADGNRDIVWNEKSKLAIEEYIFARFYMYQNVYLHKTTRGFEKMLEAMWRRARELYQSGRNVALLESIAVFWKDEAATVQQYLRLEEFTVLYQIQKWTDHADKSLSDLARRFLSRQPFAMIEAPFAKVNLTDDDDEWEAALSKLVKRKYKPPEMYCLRDKIKAKYHQPYFPEKETSEQSAKNAIRVLNGDRKPVEISELLDRLKPVTQNPVDRTRYYIPHELLDEARALGQKFTNTRKS